MRHSLRNRHSLSPEGGITLFRLSACGRSQVKKLFPFYFLVVFMGGIDVNGSLLFHPLPAEMAVLAKGTDGMALNLLF